MNYCPSSLQSVLFRYIGQYVINRALKLGLDVTSVSRSGCPIDPIDGDSAGWVEHVKWEKGKRNYYDFFIIHVYQFLYFNFLFNIMLYFFNPGDVLDVSPTVPWKSILNGQDGVVSCIGSFGSNEVRGVAACILVHDNKFYYHMLYLNSVHGKAERTRKCQYCQIKQ